MPHSCSGWHPGAMTIPSPAPTPTPVAPAPKVHPGPGRYPVEDMASPTDRVYSESHEWHKLEGNTLTLGLTRFAVDALTDVTYVQMKPKGTKFKAGDVVGEVESVKTTSDVYCFVDGEIGRASCREVGGSAGG